MRIKGMRCYRCGEKYSFDRVMFSCEVCGYSLDVEYDYKAIRRVVGRGLKRRRFINAKPWHWKYWMFYPVSDDSRKITMGEGNTPMLRSMRYPQLLFKNEGTNPTGSFKDRGSAVETSRALELGIKKVACASTGNMGASVAAYCARAGIGATIYVPAFTPKAKIAQIKAHGARVVRVRGTYENALKRTLLLREKKRTYLMGDYPTRGEGEKSVGFETADMLGWKPPRNIYAPIGNGTLIYGIFKAFRELSYVGLAKKLPRVIGVQASGCSPVFEAFEKGLDYIPAVEKPKTIATALACGNPVDGLEALNAVRSSGGFAIAVSDAEIMKARKELAREGIFAEPSGAVAYAGFAKAPRDGSSVCIVSGHGLKDPFVK